MEELKIQPFKPSKKWEWEKEKDILETLLYFSTNRGKLMLPTIPEFIHKEVIEGLVEYVTEKESPLLHDGFHHDTHLEGKMWEYLQKELTNVKRELNSRIKDSLMEMLEPHWESDEWADGEYDTKLMILFNGRYTGGICNSVFRSTFSLEQKTINRVEKEILPSLLKSEKIDLEGIGKTMQKYVERDLKYIKEQYHW